VDTFTEVFSLLILAEQGTRVTLKDAELSICETEAILGVDAFTRVPRVLESTWPFEKRELYLTPSRLAVVRLICT
jgi:hypothetical protein